MLVYGQKGRWKYYYKFKSKFNTELMLVYGQKGPATDVMLHYVYMKKSCLYGPKGPETGLEHCFKEVRR